MWARKPHNDVSSLKIVVVTRLNFDQENWGFLQAVGFDTNL